MLEDAAQLFVSYSATLRENVNPDCISAHLHAHNLDLQTFTPLVRMEKLQAAVHKAIRIDPSNYETPCGSQPSQLSVFKSHQIQCIGTVAIDVFCSLMFNSSVTECNVNAHFQFDSHNFCTKPHSVLPLHNKILITSLFRPFSTHSPP